MFFINKAGRKPSQAQAKVMKILPKMDIIIMQVSEWQYPPEVVGEGGGSMDSIYLSALALIA